MADEQTSPLARLVVAAAQDVDPMERFKTVHFWLIVLGAALGFIGQAVLVPGTRVSVAVTGLGGSLGSIGALMGSLWKPRRDRALLAAASSESKTTINAPMGTVNVTPTDGVKVEP